MATGYTAGIADGMEFREFALTCARAFGACISMRDDPIDSPLPDDFEVKPYHAKCLEAAEGELAALLLMTDDECSAAAQVDYDAKEAYRIETLAATVELKGKYDAILAQVDAWVPPTPEHENLKKFMRQQIVDSINSDCNIAYYSKPTDLPDAELWRARQKSRLEWSINYHRDGDEKARVTAQGSGAWVKALKESLR